MPVCVHLLNILCWGYKAMYSFSFIHSFLENMSFSFIHSFLENEWLTFVERKRGLGWQVKCFGNNGPRLPELAECPLWPLSEGRLPFLCSGMSVKIISATPFSISIIIAVIAICRDKLVSGVHTYIYYYYRIELWWCVKLEGRKWKCSCYFDSLKQTCMRDVSVWCLWGLLLWPGFS